MFPRGRNQSWHDRILGRCVHQSLITQFQGLNRCDPGGSLGTSENHVKQDHNAAEEKDSVYLRTLSIAPRSEYA